MPAPIMHVHVVRRKQTSTSSVAPLLLRAVCLLALASLARCAPMRPWDIFKPPCAFQADPPAKGFHRWSDPATWAGGQVPGVGPLRGGNASIPCGRAVLLDVPAVHLTLLHIQGMLKVEDTPLLPSVRISASFILVEGQFSIGAPGRHFSQQATITLLPNPNNRAPLLFSSRPPADADNPRNLGHKAFAVVGGQLSFHGMPGGPSTPSWVRLTATAAAGARSITVDSDVSHWPIGAPIALAPTDFYAHESEVTRIQNVSSVGPNKWRLALASPLGYSHFGERVSDGFGGSIEERGEVALMQRSIRIQGEEEGGAHAREGGHLVVFFTHTPQRLEGVEFARMGQQGQLGRYPVHFHMCGDQKGGSVVRKNVIRQSKQRCIVVHGTFNLYVDSNVAFDTRGHCFVVEEGGETGNTFIRNLGVWTRPVSVKISADETDDEPSTFWISNANNNYIGNVAAGAEDTGFWIELRERVRGLSLHWPLVNETVPLNHHIVGTYSGNVAHSCPVGFRDYPNGFFPRLNATASSDGSFWDRPVWVTISGFTVYKSLDTGVFIHNSDHLLLDSFSAADNTWAVELLQTEGVRVRGLRVIGQSTNYGSPTGCREEEGDCAAVTGCNFPLIAGQKGRSVGWGGRSEPLFGLLFSQSPTFTEGLFANIVDGAKFSGFDNECRTAAAIAVASEIREGGSYWNCGNGLKNIQFSNDTRTSRFFLAPRKFRNRYDNSKREDSGEAATQVALRDMDGSLVGSILGADKVSKQQIGAVGTREHTGEMGSQGRRQRLQLQHNKDLQQQQQQQKQKNLSQKLRSQGLTSDPSKQQTVRPAAARKAPSKSPAPPSTAGGFLVANHSFVLPPRTEAGTFGSCKAAAAGSNAFACPAAAHCFRTLSLSFQEPVRAGQEKEGWARGKLSFITVSRAADQQLQVFDGSIDTSSSSSSSSDSDGVIAGGLVQRLFSFTLLSSHSYTIAISAPSANPSWHPKRVMLFFADGGGCGGGVTVRVKPPPSNDFQWVVQQGQTVGWRACSGAHMVTPITVSYHCDGSLQQQLLQLQLTGAVDLYRPAVLMRSPGAPDACTAETICGVLPLRASWRYSQHGRELHARTPGGPAFHNPLFPDAKWPKGNAPLAWVDWNWEEVQTFLRKPTYRTATTYFRSSFTLDNAACLTRLLADVVVNDGVVLYINNREVLRANMPRGGIKHTTMPLSAKDIYSEAGMLFTSHTIRLPPHTPLLRDGLNVVAAEVHWQVDDGWGTAWALRLAAAASSDDKCSSL